jgi:hypothetical protein
LISERAQPMPDCVTVRFFGDFLIDRGFASRDDVGAAARRMREVNLTLAAMAQERGWLTRAQVEQIHALQLERGRVWGEQAVELGLLEPAQVARLLADQRARHVRLGEVLLESGAIERPALEHALAEFADERARACARARLLPAELERSAAARHVLEHFGELTVRIARLQTRLGDAWEWKGDAGHEYRARIALAGSGGLELGIAAERDFAAVLAEGWLGLEPHEIERDQLLDLLCELLALIGAGARAHAASQGVRLELGVPERDCVPRSGTAVEFAAPYGRGLLLLRAC